MDGSIIGFVRIADNPLTKPQGEIHTQFGTKNTKYFFLILKEVCDFSGIYVIYIPKNVFFPEVLVLSNVFGFLEANWPLK